MKRLDDLQICDLKIFQDDKLYNFSTDAVLLSNFIEYKKNDIVVDFCSGNGVVGILSSAKNFYKKIFLVEIQKSLSDLAKESIEYNKLENFEVICDDLNNIASYLQSGSVDVVTCNPPYRKVSSHIIKDNEHLNICNYEIKVNLEEIIKNAGKILKFGGTLFMINDINRLEETICLLNKYNFKTKILQIVNPKQNKNANVFLIKAVKNAKSGIIVPPNLILNDEDGNFLVKIKKGKYER